MKDTLINALLIRLSTKRMDSKLGTQTIPLLETVGHEYAHLWKFASEKHPPYLNHQKMTARRIPIVVFEVIE